MCKEKGIYEKYVKRLLDILCALTAIAAFWWLYVLITILVRVRLGSPVLFRQPRPGMVDAKTGRERIFLMHKFRTMTDVRDGNGNLLPDGERITKFGAWLRATSFDELPEAFNILVGDMSVVGPRPQLVRDMVFMTEGQRMRHVVRPGLSGLAQVNGRNGISWEEKLSWDLKYIEKISFVGDCRIIVRTVGKALVRREGISEEGMATAGDFGDYLLNKGEIGRDEYERKQEEARGLLRGI